MSDIKVGQKFECDYPFHVESYHSIQNGISGVDNCWRMGCKKSCEYDGLYSDSISYNADLEGRIIFEILAIVDMPRKYKQRVIYRFDTVDPEGVRKSLSKDYTVTVDKFLQMIEKPYRHDYEVSNG